MSETESREEPEHAPVSEEEFKQHLSHLFEAMVAISPTRNYVSQMVHLLPEERRQMRYAYPELFERMETQEFLTDGFGLEISEEEVSTKHRGPSSDLSSLINDIMEFFDDEERRRLLSEYLDQEIPNPRREWIDHKLKMAVSEPNYGEEIRSIFNVMRKYGDQQNGYRLNTERIEELTDVEDGRIREIKRFLVSELDILRDSNGEFRFESVIMEYPGVVDSNLPSDD
ncbi:hypothetical protein DJ69_12945 [Halorubrum persicum]|uniref:Uncharacterized protein n=1 Tax=Halorubrum persicum TaxID=1383844 RepID=A0A2G1WGY5_9EURY|nr:hypothetical protein [Halorubrum persicum]PHQ38252.1 hypothetical protein DJ69_12945 [Halorubrum persicum]